MNISRKVFNILTLITIILCVILAYLLFAFVRSHSFLKINGGKSSTPIGNFPQNSTSTPAIQDQPKNQSQADTAPPSQNCNIQKVSDIVRGNSMSGIVEDGQQITVLKNYYSCHEIQRNDVVIYQYYPDKEPLIKIVKAIPGDKWTLKMNAQGYEIVVNGMPLLTSNGSLYQIPAENIKMLEMYVSSYPVIPPEAYLILGNLFYGTLDSTRFGLVGKSDIIGKVITK